MALAAAPEVPGFHALSPLGAGPTSTLFSAHSEQMGRWVALTIYDASSATEGRNVRRFQRAFELARRLGVHPHAVTVLDCGVTPDRRPYLVTEFYEHGTFDSRVSGDRPLPVDKTLRIGISLAGALETAHRAEVIHGGVHPARLLADSDDEPSLADTGLVPLVDPSGSDALLGPTNYHAPPEVLEGDPLCPATDVFSLASTLYTLLTARPPYWTSDPEDTSAALLLRILRHEVPPLGRPDVPPALEQALRAALQSEPRRRPATIVAFAQSLQAVQQEIGAPVTQPVLLDVAAGLRLVTDSDADEDDGSGAAPGQGIPGRDGIGAGGGRVPPGRPAPPPALSAPPGPPAAPVPGRELPGPGQGQPPGLRPTPAPLPRPGPTPAQQVFVPYPVPEPEPDPYFGPLDLPSPHPEPAGPDEADPGTGAADPDLPPAAGDAGHFGRPPGAGSAPDGAPPPAGPFASQPGAPAVASSVLERQDRPLHERLGANHPWPPQPEAPASPPAAMAAPPVIPLGPSGTEPARDEVAPARPAPAPAPVPDASRRAGREASTAEPRPSRPLGPITGPVRLVRGPKAMPVIVLAVIVAALMAGATWMVISGSTPSGADSRLDEAEQQTG